MHTYDEPHRTGSSTPSPPPASTSGVKVRTKSESLDKSTLSQAERNVVNFIASSHMHEDRPTIVRSNSYTMQDLEKQRRSIQASLEADLCDDDPNYRYFHSASSLRGRRVSKSLPELNHLKHFPLVNSRYQNEDDDESDEDDQDNNSMRDIPEQTAWAGKSEFIFTGVTLALGLNNIWRFPYLCYQFGGGSFLWAFIICMLLFGLPILCMEYSLGQLTRRGPIAAFGTLCPLLKGVSIAGALVSFLSAPIYSCINSWSMFYFFKSFNSQPLWSRCGNPFNTMSCKNDSSTENWLIQRTLKDIVSNNVSTTTTLEDMIIDDPANHSATISSFQMLANRSDTELPELLLPINMSEPTESIITLTLKDRSLFATQQFFDRKLLEMDLDGDQVWGQIQWELILFVFITWFVVFLGLRKNILFSSHPGSCFSLLPFAFFVVFLARAVMFDGAKKGIHFLFIPTIEGMMTPQVWMFAAGLSLQSLGCVIGVSFSKATCNRERNNFLRDAFIICCINAATCIIVGAIVFITLGHLSERRGLPIEEVLFQDPGVAFIAFSELLSFIPFSAFWSVVFFFTLFCLGCHYQMSMIRSFMVAFEDAYGAHVKQKFLAHQIFTFMICTFSFLLTLIFLTQQGFLLIQLFDQYVTIILTLVLGFFEMILIGWFYGGDNLAEVIKLKISKALGLFFPVTWNFITPIGILCILVWNSIMYVEPKFREEQEFPWFLNLGIVSLVIALVMLIPVVGYRQIMRSHDYHMLGEKDSPPITLVPDPEGGDKGPNDMTSEWTKITMDPTSGNHSHHHHHNQTHQHQTNRHQSLANQFNHDTPSRSSSSSGNKLGQQQYINNTNNKNSPLARIPVTLSLIQGLDRETDL